MKKTKKKALYIDVRRRRIPEREDRMTAYREFFFLFFVISVCCDALFVPSRKKGHSFVYDFLSLSIYLSIISIFFFSRAARACVPRTSAAVV